MNNAGQNYFSSNMPWPGHYYPNSEDSINIKWDTFILNGVTSYHPSASEKYVDVFSSDSDSDTMKDISENKGILSPGLSTGETCFENEDCGIRTKCSVVPAYDGHKYCINSATASWWGLCDRWASAAIKTKEPLRKVTCDDADGNDVTFEIDDLKALSTYTYLYDASFPSTDDFNMRFARFPIYINETVAPQDLHVALLNTLGKNQSAFNSDIDASIKVWNHPIFGYKIMSKALIYSSETIDTYHFRTRVYYVKEPPSSEGEYIDEEYQKKAFTPIINDPGTEIMEMIVEGGVIVGEDVLACVYDPSTTTCRYEACVNDNPVAIPDDSSFIMSEIEVSSFIWTVNNVIIGIDITHPDVSELDIRLISPEGTVAFVGSFDGENLIRENINIDDFAYEAAEGIWTLQIRDTIANGNSGMLNSWSLKIEKSNLRF